MAVGAAIRQRGGVDERSARALDRFRRFQFFQLGQIARLVALAARLFAHVFRIHPVVVAVGAGGVARLGEASLLHLAVAVVARHVVFLDVVLVTEAQRIGFLFVTSDRHDEDKRRRADRRPSPGFWPSSNSAPLSKHVLDKPHRRRPRYPRCHLALAARAYATPSISPAQNRFAHTATLR